MKRIKKWLYRILFISIVLAAFVFFVSPYKYRTKIYRWYYSPEKYLALCQQIRLTQTQLRNEYHQAPTAVAKKRILEQATKQFENYFEQLLKYWYGTPWSFDGTTKIPGKGSIACGYFVTTVLEDMGYPINRISMAQAASETMIRNTIGKHSLICLRVGVSMYDFLDEIEKMGNGIYLLGLDTHTGFLRIENGMSYFIHSSRTFPKGVRKQSADFALSFRKSNYRVAGKLPIEKWLE